MNLNNKFFYIIFYKKLKIYIFSSFLEISYKILYIFEFDFITGILGFQFFELFFIKI